MCGGIGGGHQNFRNTKAGHDPKSVRNDCSTRMALALDNPCH